MWPFKENKNGWRKCCIKTAKKYFNDLVKSMKNPTYNEQKEDWGVSGGCTECHSYVSIRYEYRMSENNSRRE